MKALVGYTGFVGGNLAASADFDGLYNSKNMIASITSLYTCSQKDKVSQANICCHFHESWEKKLNSELT